MAHCRHTKRFRVIEYQTGRTVKSTWRKNSILLLKKKRKKTLHHFHYGSPTTTPATSKKEQTRDEKAPIIYALKISKSLLILHMVLMCYLINTFVNVVVAAAVFVVVVVISIVM